MRLHCGAPPADQSFAPLQEGWSRLREPSPFGLQIMAIPVMLATVALLVYAWQKVAPDAFQGMSFTISAKSGDGSSLSPAVPMGFLVLMGLGGLILIHEVLHAVSFPRGGVTFVGVWPTRLLFYAAYHGAMSRNRFLGVLFAPFLVLSIFPLIAAALLGRTHGLLAITSILNGAFACGDLVGMALIAAQVPAAAILRNQGWQTWWRIDEKALDGLFVGKG